jgi:hypothetical protein
VEWRCRPAPVSRRRLRRWAWTGRLLSRRADPSLPSEQEQRRNQPREQPRQRLPPSSPSRPNSAYACPTRPPPSACGVSCRAGARRACAPTVGGLAPGTWVPRSRLSQDEIRRAARKLSTTGDCLQAVGGAERRALRSTLESLESDQQNTAKLNGASSALPAAV